MASQGAFYIAIEVAEGQPRGLLFMRNEIWNGLGISFPRDQYSKILEKHKKMFASRSGVYILWGPPDLTAKKPRPRIYVGLSDNLADRMKSHLSDKWWTRAVLFTRTDKAASLNGSQLRYLEANLYRSAMLNEDRYEVINDRKPNEPKGGLRPSDKLGAAEYLKGLLNFLPIIGIDAFEELIQLSETDAPNEALSGDTSLVKTSRNVEEESPFLENGKPARQLLDAFHKTIMSHSGVEKRSRQFYIAYKLKTNFVHIVPRDGWLRLWLNIGFEELDDPRELTTFARPGTHWSKGEVTLAMRSEDELAYIVYLVQQALKKQRDDDDDDDQGDDEERLEELYNKPILEHLPPASSHVKQLYRRQGGCCPDCKGHFAPDHMQVDHILRKSDGGTDHSENLQLLCAGCHQKKTAAE